MKIARIRFKKGVRRAIKNTQVLYDFICPIKNVEVGDYVVVEVKHKRSDDFHVGRVEEIEQMSEEDVMINKPYSCVVCLIPVRDFDKRCRNITDLKFKQYSKYNGTYYKRIKE